MEEIIRNSSIESKIYLLRGYKVMLSHDLAKLYGIKTKALIQAIKRNMRRFPPDFMFQLTWNEIDFSRSQIVTLNNVGIDSKSKANLAIKRGKNIKYLPYAFTEQGVAMLSSVINSERAVQVNIVIMRTFVKLREILSTHKELAYKLAELEGKIEKHDEEIRTIFEAIRQLMAPPPESPKRRIGFK